MKNRVCPTGLGSEGVCNFRRKPLEVFGNSAVTRLGLGQEPPQSEAAQRCDERPTGSLSLRKGVIHTGSEDLA